MQFFNLIMQLKQSKKFQSAVNFPRLKIYTDGSSLGNPGPGGWGVVILDARKKTELSGYEPHTTNNRMEMQAIIEALKWTRANRKTTATIDLYTDSNLLVQSLTKNWKRKKNLDLWAELDQQRLGLNITYHWVKGHSSNRYNNRCDRLAVQAAEKIARNPGLAKASSSKSAAQTAQATLPGFSPSATENPTTSFKASPQLGQFTCPQCRQTTQGRLSLLPDSKLIRADCLHCNKFIMFAPKTKTNIQRAKKRPLLTRAQLKKIIQLKKKQGHTPTEKQIQQLKTWTQKEASKFLAS